MTFLAYNQKKEGLVRYVPTKREIKKFAGAGINIKEIYERVYQKEMGEQINKENRMKYLEELLSTEDKIHKSASKKYN